MEIQRKIQKGGRSAAEHAAAAAPAA